VTKPNDSGPSQYGWHSGDQEMFRCEQEFVFKHLRKIQKAGIKETPRAKAIGLLFHAGRARWFAEHFPPANVGWASVYQAVIQEAARQPLPVPIGAEQEACNILQQYVSHYAKLPKPEVLAAELEVGPIVTVEGSSELHTNRLDDLSKYPDFAHAEAIGEAKTTSSKPNAVYAHYNANHGQLLKQMLVVTTAIKQGKLEVVKAPIGIVLDVVQKGYGGAKCSFERFLITIEPYQLEWFARDLERVRQRRRELERLDPLVSGDRGSHNLEPEARRNPTACRRLVSGDGGQFIAVDCPYLALCKFGRSAATEYTVNGQPAGAVRSNWWA
jgi:hypothetical protein